MTTLFTTAADRKEKLGRIPLDRIRLTPPPGMATEDDLLRVRGEEGRICELVDGVLVEKPIGYYESRVAAILIYFLERFLDDHDLGVVLAPDGFLRILTRHVRAPDVSFLRWERFPGRELPSERVPGVAPDLAVEILSEGNTEEETASKVSEYFESGARRVWIIDPATETARAYTSPTDVESIGRDGVLEGGDVLPAFALALGALFARAGRRKI